MQSKWEIQQRLMKLSIRQVILVRYYLHNHLQNYYLRAPTLQTSEIYNKFEDDYGEVPTEKNRPSLKKPFERKSLNQPKFQLQQSKARMIVEYSEQGRIFKFCVGVGLGQKFLNFYFQFFECWFNF